MSARWLELPPGELAELLGVRVRREWMPVLARLVHIGRKAGDLR